MMPKNKNMNLPQEIEKKFDFLLEGLFVPPKHASNPPIVDWSHWHSKESYGDIKNKLKLFLASVLKSERERVIGLLEGMRKELLFGEHSIDTQAGMCNRDNKNYNQALMDAQAKIKE